MLSVQFNKQVTLNINLKQVIPNIVDGNEIQIVKCCIN